MILFVNNNSGILFLGEALTAFATLSVELLSFIGTQFFRNAPIDKVLSLYSGVGTGFLGSASLRKIFLASSYFTGVRSLDSSLGKLLSNLSSVLKRYSTHSGITSGIEWTIGLIKTFSKTSSAGKSASFSSKVKEQVELDSKK